MNRSLNLEVPLIIALLLTFISCEKGAFFNAGEIVSREVLLQENISTIEANTMSEITLVQDTVNKAIITCGANLQPDIDIYVKEDILHINNTIKYSWSRSYEKIKLELHLISIPLINVRMPTYITTRDTFKANDFFLVDWGTFTELDVTLDVKNCAIDVSSDEFGHFTVKGKAINARFNGLGSSFIYADGLQAQNCTVNQLSIGDIYVNVSNELTVMIESTGRVFYYGNPSRIVFMNNFSRDKLIHLTK